LLEISILEVGITADLVAVVEKPHGLAIDLPQEAGGFIAIQLSYVDQFSTTSRRELCRDQQHRGRCAGGTGLLLSDNSPCGF
jgi:hypothetical protein